MPGRMQLIARRLFAQLQCALPCACALCGATAASALCAACERHFFLASRARCCHCALPLPETHATDADAQRCGSCLQAPPAFDATIVVADYVAPVDQLVLALKFGGRLALAPLLARLLRDALLHEQRASLPTLLVAVPLGARRLAERGFNQALEIARPLTHSLGITLSAQLVLRVKETAPQARLHPQQRHSNMRDAFCLAHGADVHGQHIGVVDDVMTTGATLNAMALLLKHHGAVRVTNLVFARTLPK